MRIVRIVSAGYQQGGAENGIVLTNEILRKRGHEVIVISATVRPGNERYSDVEFASVPSHGLGQVINTAFNFSAYRITKKVLADFKPDVVLLHTMSQPTASVLFLLKNYKVIQFVHGPEVFTKTLLPWYLRREDYSDGSYGLSKLTPSGWAHYLYFRFICHHLYKIGMRNVDMIVALSNYTHKLLAREGYDAKYIPNGVRLFDAYSSKASVPVLLYAGRLEIYKGVADLFRTMPAILKRIPNTHLEIAGTGSYEEDLRRLAVTLHIQDHVTFLGHLKPDELEKAYRRCTIFIMPSRWPETFGKVGVEAMSVGRPVIATDVGGVSDWLHHGKNGYLVEPNSAEQIAEYAIKIIASKKLAKQLSSNSRKISEKFSMEKMTDAIEELINL